MSIASQHNLPLEQLREVAPEDLYGVDIAGINPTTGYNYELGFYRPDEPRPGYVAISSEAREKFLVQGSEEEARAALIGLGHVVRGLCGGVFAIHPFYGAVTNTRVDSVSPDFLTKRPNLHESLGLSIKLSDHGYIFDESSTKEAVDIGPTVVVPGPKSQRLLNYLRAPKLNPNQKDRDQAVVNNLGARWDAEFKRFNGAERIFWRRTVRKAIDVTPANILQIMSKLEAQHAFAGATIATLQTSLSRDAEIQLLNKLYDES